MIGFIPYISHRDSAHLQRQKVRVENRMLNGSMKGSLLTGAGQMEIRDFQIPEPGPDEARLRLLKAGICGSDLHIYAGHFNGIPYPLTTGHEGLGIIDKCGANVASERLGERVVIEPNFPCLECRYCKRGQGNICPRKRIFGVRETGCFAEYAVVPARFLWKVPASISNDDAILIEPSAVALHAIKMCSAEPGSTIAVIGLGAIGLLVVQIALALGYQVVVHDKIPLKMGLPERWGAKKVVESSLDVLNAAFTEADVLAVIETAGSADGTRTAIESAPRGAKVVLVGLALEPIQITAMPLTRNGTQIFTSMIYDHPQDFRQVIDLISNGRFFPSQIISSRVTLEGLPRTIDMLLKQTMETKIVVDFE